MKSFLKSGILFAVTLIGLGGLILATTATPARADIQQTPVFARTSPTAALNVAAGAVINSGTLAMSNVNECTVLADNSLGGATRALNINFLGPDQSTIVYQQSITIAIAGRAAAVISDSVAAASVPAGFTILPTKTAPYMSFQLAAGGAAAGSLSWFCR